MATTLVEKPATPSLPARPAATSVSASSERIHYLDNLRALAMMLGVFLHGAFAYARPSQTFWLATDPQSSITIDASIWFIHLFRMGLFFLISGYFAKLVLVRSGMRQMLRQRAIRLVIPFVLFYPILLAAMSIVIVFGLSYVDEPRGLIGLISEASHQAIGSERGQSPGTMHLWFIYYLIFFTLIGAIASRFRALQWSGELRRTWLIGLAPLILLPGVIAAGVPLPGPDSFVPACWPFAFYGPFYWAGWHWYGREELIESMRPYTRYLIAGSIVLFLPYYACMPVLDLPWLLKNSEPLSWWQRGAASLLTAYLAVALTVASLLVGKQLLSRPSAKLKFLADSSYWVYLIHLPIVLFLQTLLIPFDWNLWLKLALTLTATFLFCMATYVVFVRYTPLGWLLHGRRSFP